MIKALRDSKGRFIIGHQSISSWIKGSRHSDATKKKLSIKHKAIINHPGRFQKGKRNSPEIIIKAGLGHRGKHNSPQTEFKKGEHRNISTEFKKGNIPPFKGKKGIHLSPNTEFKVGHKQTPEEKIKIRQAMTRRPTSPEIYVLQLLNKYFPNKWKYTGDYSLWIGNFNPDFISTSDKLIIEFDGKYWHSIPNMIKRDFLRNKTYQQHDYKILSINENDLVDEKELINRITIFMQKDKQLTFEEI